VDYQTKFYFGQKIAMPLRRVGLHARWKQSGCASAERR